MMTLSNKSITSFKVRVFICVFLLRIITFCSSQGCCDDSSSTNLYSSLNETEVSFISSIHPTSGHVTGGTTIIVAGVGFGNSGLTCQFGNEKAPARFISSTSVECKAPPKAFIGSVPFSLTSKENGENDTPLPTIHNESLTFAYYEDVVIQSIFPTKGMIGSRVTIWGDNFVPSLTLSCVFGGVVVPAKRKSSNEVNCIVPPYNFKEKVQVSVSINGVDFSTPEISFEYILSPPQISSIQPSIGSISGGTPLTVFGSGFLNSSDLRCLFGKYDTVPGLFISTNEIRCITPESLQPGIASVEILLAELNYVTNGAVFRYIATPQISTIHPKSGPITGDTLVIIHGHQFIDSDIIQCRFGKLNAAGRFISKGKIECRSPAQKAGRLPVSLTLNGIEYYQGLEQFEYHKPIVIMSLSPKSSLFGGGTNVTLVGDNFIDSSDLKCRFDGVVVPAVFYNAKVIGCYAPAGLIGESIKVTASNNGVDFCSPSKQPFKYYNTPRVTSVSPQRGIASKHTVVSVFGFGFVNEDELSCSFSDFIRVPAKYNSKTKVICTLPPIFFVGVVSVEVSLNNRDYTGDGIQFELINEPHIHSIWPSRGPVNGPTKVTVAGDNFVQRLGIWCHFGAVHSHGVILSSDKAECEAPPVVSSGKVGFRVSVADGISSSNEVVFYYMPSAFVSSLTPHRWTDTWTGSVVVNGNGFYSEVGCPWTCLFGGIHTSGEFTSADTLACLSPKRRLENASFSLLYPCSQSTVKTAILLNTVEPLIMKSFWPASSPTAASTPLIIELIYLRMEEHYICLFDEVSLIGVMLNATHLTCESPEGGAPRTATLSVNYADSETEYMLGRDFLFYQPPVVMSVIPVASQITKKEFMIKAIGQFFLNSRYLTCKFGDKEVNARWLSSTEVECRRPILKPGLYTVEVSNNAVDFTFNHLMHEVLPDLQIFDVSPKEAGLGGGVAVKVIGLGFHSSLGLSCAFGNTLTIATVIDKEELKCLTPPQLWESMLPFKVCDRAMLCVETGVFSFVGQAHSPESVDASRIVISNTSNSVVSDCGDAEVFLVGDGFRNSKLLICYFTSLQISAQVTADWFSSHMISCKIPALQAGPYSLHIENESAQSSNTLELLVVSCPVINKIYPAGGEITGGALVTVLGKNFISTDVFCRFGKRRVKAHEIIGSSIIRCRSTPGDKVGHVQFALSFHGDAVISSGIQYHYTDPLFVHTISPKVVGQYDSISLVIYGEGFEAFAYHNLSCLVGSATSVKVILDDSFSHLTCHFDEFAEAGMQSLQIGGDGHILVQNPDAVNVVPRPIVSNVSPNWVLHSDKGKRILIEGESFANTEYLSCFFDDKIQRAFFLSTTTLQCMVPDITPGQIRLRVSNDGLHSSVAYLTFQVLHPFSMQSVVPDRGWAGMTITIRGKGFFDGISCGFSTSISVATVLHKNELKCVVPQPSWLEHGPNAPIHLLLNGVKLLPEVSHYFRFVQLVVLKVFPMIGSTSGGTSVILTLHTSHAEEVTSCRFGKNVVVAVRSSSNPLNEVICISPKNSKVGIIPLSLSANGTDFSPSGFYFSYAENPTVLSIFPDSGPWRGGTIVTVNGLNFQEDMRLGCRFGERFANGSLISSSLFFCSTPALPLGPMEFFVSINSVDFISTDQFYEAVEDIVLTDVQPNSAPVNSAVNVTILGKNFRNTKQLSCRFGYYKVLGLFISSHEIICLAPAEISTKTVQVEVTVNGYDFCALPMLFRYHSVIELHSFFPSSGPVSGLTSVTLTGSHFLSGPTMYKCIFGELVREAVIFSDSVLVCNSPASTIIGSVKLLVSGPGFILSANEGYFTYEPLIETFALFPSFGFYGSKQVVRIYGSHFSEGIEFCCKIRGVKYLAVFISPTEAKCIIDDTQRPGLVDIAISNNGQNFAEKKLFYEITEEVDVLDFRPILKNDEKGVVIIGSNFLPFDGLSCQLDHHYFSIPSVINRTHIECDMPYKPLAPDSPFEGIFLNGKPLRPPPQIRNKSWASEGFSVFSVVPRLIATVGGTLVNIQMQVANEREIKNCFFGEVVVPSILSLGDPVQEIICMAPATFYTGTVILSLSANSPEYKPCSISITYVENAIVESIFPESGPSVGSSVITIFGSNFREDMHLGCRFGEILVGGSWESSSRFSCVSPSLPTGAQNLVIVGDVVVINNSFSFFVFSIFSFYEVKPFKTSAKGEIVLNVSKVSFSMAISCLFEGYSIPARFIKANKIGCIPPPYPSIVNTDLTSPIESMLRISINGQDYLPGSVKYSLAPRPTVTEIFPNKGKAGTYVTVIGKHFVPSLRGSFCKFGSLTVPAEIRSDSTLACTSPPSKERIVSFQVSLNGGLEWSVVGGAFFEYYVEARVEKVMPSNGIFKGGTPVAIYGARFINSIFLTCSFDGHSGTKVVWVSSTQVNCLTPAVQEPRPVQVQISNNGVDFSTEKVVFNYHGYPHVSSISPSFGFPGTTVMVSGKNFFPNSLCKFGIWTSNATYISTAQVECTAPFGPRISNDGLAVEVQISNNGLDFSPRTFTCNFTYVKSPVIHYISPTETFSVGGDSLYIHGSYLNSTGIAWCVFSPLGRKVMATSVVIQQAKVISDSLVKCVIPAQAGGTRVEVRVSVNSANDRSVTRGVYEYRRVPRIVDILPKYGSSHGGTSVSVLGHEFPDMTTECLFGSTKVPGLRLSPTKLQCISPPASTFGYIVSVSVYIGGLSIQSGVIFHYISIPTTPFSSETMSLEMASPSSSELSESLSSLMRSGAHAPSGYHYHGSWLRVKQFSAQKCYKSDVIGYQNRTLRDEEVSEKSRQLTSGMVYEKEGLRYFSISPTFGPDIGNSTIIIKGNLFLDTSELYCRFGPIVTKAEFRSQREISCKTPMMPSGNAEFSLTLNNATYFSAGVAFMFYKPVHIDSISPQIGSCGTAVKIYCTNLFAVPSAVCRFGKIHVPASFTNEAGVMFCVAPELGTQGRVVMVTLSLNGNDFHGGAAGSIISFTYVPDPIILSLSPLFGWKKGGTVIFARTDWNYSYPQTSIYCVFGSDDFVLATWTASDYVRCIAPPMREDLSVVSVYITYAMMPRKTVKTDAIFTYIDAAIVIRVSPSWGSVIGGTLVDVYGENFLDLFDLCCKFSNYITSAEFVSSRHVKCLSPKSPNAGQVVLVEVFSLSGSLKTYHSKAQFQYHSNPTVYFFEPLYGTIEGGTTVTFYGTGFKENFSPYMQCRFGENSLPVQATFVSENKILCTSPSAVESVDVGDNVTIFISLNGRDFVKCNEPVFTYLSGIRVLSVDPMLGSISGGTLLTVKATKSPLLKKICENIMCVFEGEAEYLTTPATVTDDEGVLFCRSPPSPKAHNHPTVLSLRFNGNETSLTGTRFYYYTGPEIHNFSPLFGTYSGGEQIEVSGEGFLDVELLGCIFGIVVSPMATWVSPSKVLCQTPPIDPSTLVNENLETVLAIGVTINGVDYIYAEKMFLYVPNPTVSYIAPKSVNGSEYYIIYGHFLDRVTACRFGIFGESAPILSKSKTSVTCQSPIVSPNSQYFESRAQLYLSFGYQFVDMNISFFDGLEIGKASDGSQIIDPSVACEKPLFTNDTHPAILFVTPTSINSIGGDWITIHGVKFSSFRGTGCLFGANIFVYGQVGSSTTLYCRTPSLAPGPVSLQVINGATNLASKRSLKLSVYADSSILSLKPEIGSTSGGTPVVISGVFHGEAEVYQSNPEDVLCRFGSYDVVPITVTIAELVCLSPPSANSLVPERVKVSVSFNNGKSFSRSFAWYMYEEVVEVHRLTPSLGVISGGTVVLVQGVNFRNSTFLKCKFGSLPLVDASFISMDSLTCISPLANRSHLAKVEVTNNGVDFSRSGRFFEYHNHVTILSAWPLLGPETGGTFVTIKGSGFFNSLGMLCIFGEAKVIAHYLDSERIGCKSPPGNAGLLPFQIVYGELPHHIHDDGITSSHELSFLYVRSPILHAIFPSSGKVEGGSMVFITGSFFVNSTHLKCQFGKNTVKARLVNNITVTCITPPSKSSRAVEIKVSLNGLDFPMVRPMLNFRYEQNCGKGYVCGPSFSSWGYKSPNGTYAPHERNVNFTLCEPGYFQPMAGQANCTACPVPYICPDFGLYQPLLCPAGFVCDKVGLSYPSQRCPRGNFCLAGTGTALSSSFIDPTIESNLSHIDDFSTALLLQKSLSDRGRQSNVRNTVFHPFPCPIGYYCRDGVSSVTPVPGNFSTPQKCFKGYICPPGSFTPEGVGPCATGHYCPTATMIAECPQGHFCPGVGNTKPIECDPGTYGIMAGQSRCTLCEKGHICPGQGRVVPDLCPPGFVCDAVGLATPDKLCPSGFYCELGTATIDPDDPKLKGPRLCPAGAFCLGGVAHNKAIDWLPFIGDAQKAPQRCLEGYYCSLGSSSPRGTGSCLPGHYCPPESAFPVEVPVGTFSAGYGSIAPSLCFPGTFSPVKASYSCLLCPSGSSCISFATYTPRRCDPGTYRSMADGIACLPCPSGTFTPFSGANDVTECLPCPEGRVCGLKGMRNISDSDPCEQGHLCGLQTDRDSQSDHLSAAGFITSKGSMIKEQFSFPCSPGFVCSRGSADDGKSQSVCPVKKFCPDATSRDSSQAARCPMSTISYTEGSELCSCFISPVDICDKVRENPNNPFEDASYYALDSINVNLNYGTSLPEKQAGSGGTDTNHSEVMALKKIIPVTIESFDQLWKNNTVDIIRSCPSYGFLQDKQLLTIVGRNFRNSSFLTCRFTFCESRSVQTVDECKIKTVIYQPATFISAFRVSCLLPDIHSDPLTESFPGNQTNICGRDPDGAIFYFQQCTKDEYLANKCDQLQTRFIWAYRKVYSLLIPCTSEAIDNNACDNIPESGMRFNPCFSGQAFVEISNNGEVFSGDPLFIPSSNGLEDGLVHETFLSYTIPGTAAKFIYMDHDLFGNTYSISNVSTKSTLAKDVRFAIEMDTSRCMGMSHREEGERSREIGWFPLTFMQVAQLNLDWRQIPKEIQYDKHFKLAIFIRPSRCMEYACDNRGVRATDKESYPCSRPIELPKSFTSSDVNKHQLINLTITALDDILFKVEIHIVHGLYLASSDFFVDTMAVNIYGPSRAMYNKESENRGYENIQQRKLSPFVSYEERLVEKEYIFGVRYSVENSVLVKPPLNLPPRWKQLEKGRVLVGMNATQDSICVVKDCDNDLVSSRFWENPFNSPSDAKVETDAYLETFHGVFKKPSGEYGYNLDQVILPYLPFFSNCFEYDSFITFWTLVEDSRCALPEPSPEYNNNWWRRDYPPLPKQDIVRPIGPFDFATFNPVADWCERLIHCTYEENLKQPDRLPRWFEAGTGISLFSFIRDPIDYNQFTGRQSGRPGPDDGGGMQYLKTITSPDTFIPVIINRDAASDVEGECQELCFPRQIKLEVLYYQLSANRKRIVESSLILNDFDKNSSREDYDLHVSFRPLDYKELIVKFVFGQDIFVLLFCTIGGFTVLVASLYWLVVKFSTRLESPPKLHFVRMAFLIIPDVCLGFFLGLIPISIITFFVFLFFRGYIFSAPVTILGVDKLSLFDSLIPIHYANIKVEPNVVLVGQCGRMGLAFISMAVMIMHEGSKLFVPRVFSRLEKEMEEGNRKTAEEFIWIPHTWKRAIFVYSSLSIGVLLVILVEFSFWKNFGDHIWLFLVGLQVLGMLVSDAVKVQVGEELLHAPMLMALGLVQGIMTLSSNDFMDFLTSYVVGFGFMLLQRMFINPFKSTLYKRLIFISKVYWRKIISWVSFHSLSYGDNREMSKKSRARISPLVTSADDEKAETVEPIIEMYGDYCSDVLSLFCTPCTILILMIFRRETVMADMYGIKESDMKHYLFFSMIIIPFQIVADIFIHGSLELFHGWKIQDYLMFCKYRFRERECAWRGFERNSLDECIKEDLRTIDHLCFSSQYYMMLFIHTTGIIYFVFGAEMMIRSKYNPFGDPAMPLIMPFVFLVSLLVKTLFVWISIKLKIWKPRSSTVKWLINTRASTEKVESIDFPSPRQSFSIEKRMMEDSFRFRFIDHNRNWLLSQLPNILTPRTIKRSRPYLVNQFAKILTSLNDEISSDSETDDITPRFKATDGILNGPLRSVMKSWIYHAKRRVVMKRITESLIQRERGEYCEQCLSRKQLQVQVLIDFDVLENKFLEKYDDAEFVQATWKNFWEMHQKYQTLCLPCISMLKEKARKSRFDPTPAALSSRKKVCDDTTTLASEVLNLSSRSKQLLKKWHHSAKENRQRLQRRGLNNAIRDGTSTGKTLLYPSPNISTSSKDFAISWLSKARNNLYTEHKV